MRGNSGKVFQLGDMEDGTAAEVLRCDGSESNGSLAMAALFRKGLSQL